MGQGINLHRMVNINLMNLVGIFKLTAWTEDEPLYFFL